MPDGTYYYPHYSMYAETPIRHFWIGHRQDGPPDTLRLPDLPTAQATRPAWVRMNAGGGRVLLGLNKVPFAPAASWTLTSERTILLSTGEAHEIKELAPDGRVIRKFVGPVGSAIPIPQGIWNDSVASLRARLDSVPVPLTEVINLPDDARNVQVPTHYPGYVTVDAGADGKVYGMRWPGASRTDFDVFSRGGACIGVISLPGPIQKDPVPALARESIAAVTTDEATGVQTVVWAPVVIGREAVGN